MADEVRARRKLKAIERELKYFRKRRSKYIRYKRKFEEKNERKRRMTKKERIIRSVTYSALISLGIVIFFTTVFKLEGDVISGVTVCFSFPFIALMILMYYILEESSYFPFEKELRGVTCMINRLEREKKHIYSEFPHLENENIDIKYGWTVYSFIKNIISITITIYLGIYLYIWVMGLEIVYFPYIIPTWWFLFVLPYFIDYLEERSWENCWIREELGVDPKRLYK